ncbi:MAG TPA: HD domain-containing phosphohydrolase [Anaerolineales bacterium]|nr:HD domain-containing phosphohydrolase [Anaerolineales bacterium]
MMDDSIHILLIEDDPAHAELIQRAFEDRGDGSHLTIAYTLEEASAQLEKFKPTLIIADWRLPDGDSTALLSEGRTASSPPIIIMTSYGSERNAVEAIKAGALDYIVKSSESMNDMPHIAERAVQQWKSLQEQERMQQALAERESQFRLLAENSSDIISRHDTNGIFLYVSPACRNILGYEPDELIGESFLSYVHPDEAAQLEQFLSSSSSWDDPTLAIPYRARRKNSEYIWLETTARVIYSEENKVIEIQASSRDITERKESQVALQQAHEGLREAYDKTIEGWVVALDLRDRETEGHTQRVTQMTVRLARELRFTEEEIIHIRRGALLHDMGKMGIPDEILQKPGPLTDEEWLIMRKHPQYAYQMLSPISYLNQALIIPYYHHERWDGSGYPQGLKGDQIPLFARLFAVVDVWDALSSDRPYRKRMPPKEVTEYLEKESGRLFDPYIVEKFLPLITTK